MCSSPTKMHMKPTLTYISCSESSQPGTVLGGALAVLAAVMIQTYIPAYRADHADYTKRLLQTYTYGAPLVGDADFAKYMRDTLHCSVVQVKNKTDATPLAPPTGV